MEFEREYGVACTVEVPMLKAASDDFALGADWTPAAGDVKLIKDGVSPTNVATLPAVLASGNGATWQYALSATEMQVARSVLTIVDAGTKVVKDQQINIRTYGHPSAQDPRDVELAGIASAATANDVTLAATTNFGANYLPGKRIQVVGTTLGTRPQDRVIASTSYAAGAYTVTFDRALDTAPTGTITYKVWRTIGPVTTANMDANGRVQVQVGTGAGQLDATAGIVKSNLSQILGSAITGTAAQIVAAFTKFFNVVTPTGSVNSLPDAVPGAANGVFIAGSNAAVTVNVTGSRTGSITGSVGSVTGGVGGSVAGSVGSVLGSVGSVTGNVAGSVASVVGAVGSVTGNVGGNVNGAVGSVTNVSDKTGYTLSSAGIALILDDAVEPSVSVRQSLRLSNAAAAAKVSGASAGASTVTLRDLADTKNRIIAVCDQFGNRTTVTKDLS